MYLIEKSYSESEFHELVSGGHTILHRQCIFGHAAAQSHSGGFDVGGQFGQEHLIGGGQLQSHGLHSGQRQTTSFLPHVLAAGVIGHGQLHLGFSAGHIGQLHTRPSLTPARSGHVQLHFRGVHTSSPNDGGRMNTTQITVAKIKKIFMSIISKCCSSSSNCMKKSTN